MNVETINVWAQLIASIGVIVSLFYVAAQVRQNTRSSRAIVVDSLARSMHDLAIEMAQNDQLLTTATMLKDWNSASEMERARYASFMLGYFKLFENGWFQMRCRHLHGWATSSLSRGHRISGLDHSIATAG